MTAFVAGMAAGVTITITAVTTATPRAISRQGPDRLPGGDDGREPIGSCSPLTYPHTFRHRRAEVGGPSHVGRAGGLHRWLTAVRRLSEFLRRQNVVKQSEVAQTAHRQIAAAAALISQHHPADNGLCRCGRDLPCTVALACERTRDHHAGVLAILHATIELPIVAQSPRR
ncbi:hypothetical protein [Catellatospora sichuanensis]|uniref:hypothetical protein n=1 Tax=Catellatospora sichuanensis TaxID=1969805 RepID=UPI00118320DE|nr:hypothetical protein [Catellatospora sichuanensis]